MNKEHRRASRAAYVLQKHFGETHPPPGSKSYGEEGSEAFREAVVDLLVDLKHLLVQTNAYDLMLTDLAEEAVDRWAEEMEETE